MAAYTSVLTLTAGDLDPTFGTNGKVSTDFNSGSYDEGYSVVQQSDGKLVVAGYTYNSTNDSYDFALSRYKRDGSLDPTFGTNGKVSTDFYGDINFGYSVVQQSDGKLVVAGRTFNSNNAGDFALSRYESDGSPDPTFGTNGKVSTDFNSDSYDEGYSIVQQSDGKLVVAGNTYNSGSNYDFALSRYESDGSLDLTFGTNGKVSTDFYGSEDRGFSLVQQSDGKLVVAGFTANPSSGYDFALSRYESDGSLDLTFGTNGKVSTDFYGKSNLGRSVVQQSDGKLVVAGFTANPSDGYDFALSRYESDGSLDLTFGTNGKVSTDFNNDTDLGHSVVQQSDGKLVVAGFTYTANPSNPGDFGLIRYKSDGSLDLTFGTNGKVSTNFNGNSYDEGFSLALQPDGNIILVGRSDGNLALARYLTSNQTFNVIQGTAGSDRLEGGAGEDFLAGGAGDDVYYVVEGDTLVEKPNEGNDTAFSSINWTLSANVEQLILQGSATVGTGNSLDNILRANKTASTLYGLEGNDILIGGNNLTPVFSATQRTQFLGTASPAPSAFDESFYLAQNPDVAAAVSAGAFTSGLDHFTQFGQTEGRAPNNSAGSEQDVKSAVFDEGYYLFHNPDVAAAVSAGTFKSGFEHFKQFGQFEGRSPSTLYDESFYLAQNPDVASAVAGGIFKSGFQHFIQFGQFESRDPSHSFSNSLYLSENPDVAAAITAGAFKSGFDHFIQFGQTEGRDDNSLFSERFYLSQNPDVAAAVASGAFKSGFAHFIRFGQTEGRAPSELYNESFYLSIHPDVAAAVASGVFKSGFAHFIQHGEQEGRSALAAVNHELDGGNGDDILYGGAGGILLKGRQGSDRFWVADQISPRAASTIVDFEVGVDAIVITGLPEVTGISSLNITQQGADTSVSALGRELATLVGVQATNLNNSSFLFTAKPVV